MIKNRRLPYRRVRDRTSDCNPVLVRVLPPVLRRRHRVLLPVKLLRVVANSSKSRLLVTLFRMLGMVLSR